jgi:elongation of very long chain fatty acids protein 6
MATNAEINATARVSKFIEAYDFEVYDIFRTKEVLEKLRPLMYAVLVLYLVAIYFGQKWMKSRPAYSLSTALFLWNLSLSIFSIVSTLRAAPEILFLVSQPDGVYTMMCTWEYHNYASSFWGLMLLISKFVELGDTAFIVLRKRKLIFLHWFHHLATLLLSWFGYEYYDAIGRFYCLNTFVHSWMYSYYALRALKVRIPRKLSMALTTLQILQMFVALGLNFSSVYFMAKGLPCGRSVNVLYLLAVIVVMFAALFINFFIQTYVRRGKTKVQ